MSGTNASIYGTDTDLSIVGGEGKEKVNLSSNSTIWDGVDLGGNDDSFDATSGTVFGSINMGEGDDIATLNGEDVTIFGQLEFGKGDDQLIATAGTIMDDILMGDGSDTAILNGNYQVMAGKCLMAVMMCLQPMVGSTA
ncbi:hypothetical protein ACUHGC_01905 [Testudinibacter sp. P27/CKL/0425]